MRSRTPRAAAALAGLACAFAFAGHTQAGIVVLENGQVFVGKIRADGVTNTSIVLRGVAGERGQFTVPRHRVRWFDADANTLTDDYFDAHLDATLLGGRWITAREAWITERNRPPLPPIGEGILIGMDPVLDSIPTSFQGFKVNKPYGWDASLENGIMVFKAPKRSGSGFTPRIHIFSVESVDGDRSDQVTWIRKELERVSGEARFQIVELNRLRQVDRGENQRLVTETAVRKRKVLAVREVCFRDERTYFFAAYADARDFPHLREILELSRDSLELASD